MSVISSLSKIINVGVRPGDSFREQRQVLFANVLSLLVGVFCTLYFLIGIFYTKNTSGAILTISVAFLALAVPLLNKSGARLAAKTIIAFLPILTTVLIPPIAKYLSMKQGLFEQNFTFMNYVYGKMASLACLAVPYVVFDMRERINRVVLPFVMVIIMFLADPIHSWLGVGPPAEWNIDRIQLNYTNFVIMTSAIVLLVCLHFITKLNVQYENKMMDMVEELSRKTTGLKREIDERIRSEMELERAKSEALAAVRSRTAFFAQINHEIRTPLHGISSMSDLLENSNNPEENATLVRGLRVSVTQLIRLLNNVLDLNKIESEKFELEARPFRISEVLNKISGSYEYLTLEKKQTLTVRSEDPVDSELLGDDLRIIQVLNNFIVNALKHGAGKEIRLNAKVSNNEGNLRTVRFEVINDGNTIPENMLNAIFEEHTQLSGTKLPGSGLGLFISKRILEAMGSRPVAECTPEGKMMFWFELSLPVAD